MVVQRPASLRSVRARCGSLILSGLLWGSCRDPVGNGNGEGTLQIELFGLPAVDTLRQPGLEFAFEAAGVSRYARVEVVVDAGTTDERTFAIDSAWLAESPARVPVVVPAELPNGPHEFELRAESEDGKRGTKTFEYVVHVPSHSYTLDYLGTGFADSRASDINATGAIVGTLYSGSSAPFTLEDVFVWENGTMRHPPAQAGVTGATTSGINDQGDVVGFARFDGEHSAYYWPGDSLRPIVVNGLRAQLASDIDNSRRAAVRLPGLTTAHFVSLTDGSATSLGITAFDLLMNGNAQVISVIPHLYGSTVEAYGITFRGPERRPGRHERYFRGIRWVILGLNDAGDVLGTRDGDPFLSHGDTVEYIDQRIPRGRWKLSATGEVVSASGVDSIFVWSPAAGTRRVQFTNPGWIIDGLNAMNAQGKIVVHGTNSTTSERGVLLLSPTP